MSFSQINFILSYLFTGIILLFLGLFVLIKQPKNKLNLTFMIYSFSVSWWSLFSVLMITSKTEYWGTFWDRICLLGVVFIPATFIHFNYTLLKKDNISKLFIAFNYFLSLFYLCFAFSPLMVIRTAPNKISNFFTVAGPLYLSFIIYFYLISIWGIWCFLDAMLKEREGTNRQQIKYLFWSTLLGYTGGGFNYNLVYGIGIPDIAPFGNYAVGIYGMIVAYAITKTNFLNIKVIISRGLAHFLTILGFGTIYTIIVILYTNYVSSKIGLPFYLLTILLGILVGNLYDKVRDHIQTPADQFFVKSWYDFPQVVAKLSSIFAQTNSRRQIVARLSKIFKEEIDVPDLNFFFLDKGTFVKYDKETFEPCPTGEIMPQDKDLTEAGQKKDVIFLEKNNSYKAALLVPVFNADNELFAFFTLGEKRSKETYTNKDLDLLRSVSSQIFMSLEYVIKPYEEVRRKFEETERKFNETEKMFTRSARLASLGTLTAGVTHEIRNPLAVIRTEAELLPKRERDHKYLEDHGKIVLKHIDRIENIIEKMLYLSKTKEIKRTEINLNNLIEEYVLSLVSAKNVKITKQLNPIPNVLGVMDDLHQVIINLTDNAIIAMREKGGILTYKTYPTTEGDAVKIVVEVADTGNGILQENIEKIFNPFFSTRHEGTGLGLSISNKIIEEYKGRIEVKSKIGEGTTFRVILPAI